MRKAAVLIGALTLASTLTGAPARAEEGACGVGGAWQEWSAHPDVDAQASLQRGARDFVNYCLGCHSLKYARYNRMADDLGISEDQLKKDLLFTGGHVHDYMLSTMASADAENWFGRAPPDLSLTALAKGSDYIYQYLKTFYLDDSRPTGVNNLALPNAAMPHVLASLQGTQKAVFVLQKCVDNGQDKMVKHFERFEQVTPGSMNPAEYDAFVHDLVNFLYYTAEPTRAERERLGLWVILFLIVFTLLARALKKEIWKDIH